MKLQPGERREKGMSQVLLMADVFSLDRELQALKRMSPGDPELTEARERWLEHYAAVFDREDLEPGSSHLKRVNLLYDQFHRHFVETDARELDPKLQS